MENWNVVALASLLRRLVAVTGRNTVAVEAGLSRSGCATRRRDSTRGQRS